MKIPFYQSVPALVVLPNQLNISSPCESELADGLFAKSIAS
jgi:hypothetical protein